jgi:hypothetical protein
MYFHFINQRDNEEYTFNNSYYNNLTFWML